MPRYDPLLDIGKCRHRWTIKEVRAGPCKRKQVKVCTLCKMEGVTLRTWYEHKWQTYLHPTSMTKVHKCVVCGATKEQ